MGESEFIALVCISLLGGEPEQRHYYNYGFDKLGNHQTTHVRVDCETETHVYEIGKDSSSSFDSLHQTVFASHLTGKTPTILIFDTDDRFGQHETQIRDTARLMGVTFKHMPRQATLRFEQTGWMRSRPKPVSLSPLN
ncbi:MAG: hypothetical protein AAF714_09875 [Pseudomonadota bacterium]